MSRSQGSVTPSPPSPEKAPSTSMSETVKDAKVRVWPNVQTQIPCGHVHMRVCSPILKGLHTLTYIHMYTLPL